MPRITAIVQFKKYMFPYDKKIEKWERLGYSIERDGFDSIVDGTQKYDRSIAMIEELGGHSRLYKKVLSYVAVKSEIFTCVDHVIGDRVITIYPPCDVNQDLKVQSPKNSNVHELFLPTSGAVKDIKKKNKAVDSELLIDDGEDSYGDEILENLG